MTINANYSGNISPAVWQQLTASSVKIGNAAANANLTLSGWTAANDTGSSVDVSVYWWDASAAVEKLIWKRPVPANDSLDGTAPIIRLDAGDEIRAKGAASVYITLNYSFNFQNTSMG